MAGNLVATTVRYSESVYALISRAAERAGVPFAQYVREAALSRASFELGRAVDGDRLTLGEALAEARRRLDESGGDGARALDEFLVAFEQIICEHQA